MSDKIQLYCDIVRVTDIPQFSSPNYEYVVEDSDGVVVATGVSSSAGWVMHDAGGYHTENDFNDKYGRGNWHVNFRNGFDQ